MVVAAGVMVVQRRRWIKTEDQRILMDLTRQRWPTFLAEEGEAGSTSAGSRLSRRESQASAGSAQAGGSLERRSSLRADPMQATPWPGGGDTTAAAGEGQEGHHPWATLAGAATLDRYLAATAPLARVSRPIPATARSTAWPQLRGTKAAGRLVKFRGKVHVVLFAGPTPTSSAYEANEVLWAHPQEEARQPGASLWEGAVAIPLTRGLAEGLQSAAPMRLPRSPEDMELEAALRGTKVVELINVPHRAWGLLQEFLVNGPGRPAPEQEWPPPQQGMLS